MKEAPIDVATEIFTRINEGGKPLSPFEIMVAKTFDSVQGFDLAQESDRLLEELTEVEYETIPETVFLQIVSTLLTKDCHKRTILNLKKQAFIKMWPEAIEAVRRAVDYLRTMYRIPASRLLPYPALLVPFAYFFHKHPKKPDAVASKRLADLFWRVSLGGAYSSSLETKLAHDIKRIDAILKGNQPFYEEPLKIDADFVWENGWFGTGRAFVRAILCLLAAHGPESFLDGSKVVLDNDWLIQANSKNYHHFFPRAYLKRQGLEEWEINNVANITIVDDYLNKQLIRDKAPGTYMKQFKDNGRLRQTMRTHLINLESDGVWENDYRRFARARCRAIARELNKRLITSDVPAPEE